MKNTLKLRWNRIPRWTKWLGGLVVIAGLIVVLRVPILRGLGNALIYENDLVKSEVLFVLSGSPVDRGSEAARLIQDGWAEHVVCTGELIPHELQALNLEYRESDLTKRHLVNLGIPDSVVEILGIGTSTKEEAQAIKQYCLAKGVRNCIILSNDFHTRRVKKAFRKPFKRAGIAVCIRGAPSSTYTERDWWRSESGLLTVNNEYMKMIWYLFK